MFFQDDRAIEEFISTVEQTRANTLNVSMIENIVGHQNKATAEIYSGVVEPMTSMMQSHTISKRRNEVLERNELAFRDSINNLLRAEEMPGKDGTSKIVIMDQGKRFQVARMAVATGMATDFVDAFFNDIDLSKYSNMQKYNNIAQVKHLELLSKGITDEEERNSFVSNYMAERISPMVAAVMSGNTDDVDENDYKIIRQWLDRPSKISSDIETLNRALQGDIFKGDRVVGEDENGKIYSTRHIFPDIDVAPLTEAQKEQKIKNNLMGLEVTLGLASLPLSMTGSTLAAGGVIAMDLALGIPAVFTGKDTLQKWVLGADRADDLTWWQMGLYAIPALAGAKTIIKGGKSKLSQGVFKSLNKKIGKKSTQNALSSGRASTEIALKSIVDTPEFKRLEELSNSGKLSTLEDIELSDMIQDIKDGVSRSNEELSEAYARGKNPIQALSQNAARGDTEAIKNLHELVVKASKGDETAKEALGGVDPNMILNYMETMGKRNVAEEMIKDLNPDPYKKRVDL